MEATRTQRPGEPGKLLYHPATLVAILVVAINDHLLKGAGLLPGWATGKVSDVAGLFFFPIFLAVSLAFFLSLLAPRRRWTPRALVDTACLLTVLVFATINLSEVANAWAAALWGGFTLDPTDLLCLPMVLVARRFALRRWSTPGPLPARPGLRAPEALALFLAALVSVATSAPTHMATSGFPFWSVVDHQRECRQDITITPWIARSSKEGFGLVLRFDSHRELAREIHVDRATAHLQESLTELHGSIPSVEALPVEPVTVHNPHHHAAVYIPFAFDNQGAWNQGLRRATIYIDLVIDGEPTRLRLLAEHRSAELREEYDRSRVRHLRGADPDGPARYGIELRHHPTQGCQEVIP